MPITDLKHDLAALRIERGPQRAGVGRWIVATGLLILLAALGLGAWRWATRERATEVQVAAVTERAVGTQAAVLNASGYVTARRRATISSKITGKVVEENVEEGMAVREGQVLARLDDQTARAGLALAEAQADAARRGLRENEVRLDQARRTEKRLAQLLTERVVGQAELDSAKADADSIEARIFVLKEQITVAERQTEVQQTELNSTVIRAPFSGVAITKDAQPGEMVSPVSAGGGFTRTGICTIVDMQSLEIDVDVNESYINRVKPGQEVFAVLNAYPDWQIPGHVITLVPTADRQKATVLVRIGFKQLDPRILPDMAIKVTFLRQSRDSAAPAAKPTALVPKAGIAGEGNQSFSFVVRGDVVEKRAVKLGGADGDRVEVLAGLQSGDRVVISPPPDLKDGSKVAVK
jgi:RND family efflux transporter MFP subunit